MSGANNHYAPDSSADEGLAQPIRRSGWVLLFCLAALAIAAAGFTYYRYEANRIREEKSLELTAIARLKTDQILRWRQERIWDARRFAQSIPVRKIIEEWLQNPTDAGIQADLRQRLSLESETSIYCEALLMDTNARVVVASKSAPGDGDDTTRQAIVAALASPQPVLGEWHRGAADEIQLDVTAAVRDDAGRPMAVVVLTVAASEYLYPLIQSWPAPSRSGETLLVRQEGDDVLFLNELRFRTNSALVLRQPLTLTNLPAVQAVLGRTGMVLGRDYRDAEVLADLSAIPGTAWFMVAKMDTAEVFAEARYRATMIWMVTLALILFAGGMTAYFYRTRQLAERKRAAAVLRESEARYRRLHESMTDAYASVDMTGRLLESNRAFREMLGYEEAELRSLTYEDITPANWHAMEAELVRTQILPRGYSDVFEKEYRRKDGTVFPVELRTFLLRDEAGQPAAMWAIVRDITARKQAETRIRQLNRVYALLSDINQAIVRALDPQDLYAEACRIAVEKGGFRMAWIGLLDAQGRRVNVTAHAGVSGDYLEKLGIEMADPARGNGPVAAAVRSGEHVVCNDLNQDPRMVPWRADALRLGYRSLASFPLTVADQTAGAFSLYAAEAGFFDAEELRLLDELAMDISFALEVHRRGVERQRAELALRESELRYQDLYENAPDMYLSVDATTGNVIQCNRTLAEVTGFSKEEIIGQPVFELHHPENQSAARRLFESFLAAGTVRDAELQVRRKDGSRLDVSINVSAVRDERGRIRSTRSVWRDITDRKRAEAALRASERKFRGLTQQMPDFVWQKDSAGVYVSCNKQYADTLGLRPETIAGRRDEDFYPADLVAKYRTDDQRVIASGQPLETEEQWRQGNDARWLHTRKVPLLDEQGRCIGTIGIGRDITDRRQVERALRESETRYRQMLRSVTDYIYRVDYENGQPRSTTHGPGCQGVTGYKPEDYVSNPYLWFEMIHPEDRGAVEQHARRILQGESSEPLEHRILHQDGSVRWVRNTLLPRRDAAGHLITCDGLITDITERKDAERALARDEAELSAIYEHAPAMMCLLSGEGRVRRLNRAALEFAGGSSEDAAGKGPGDFMSCVEALKVPEGCGHGPACATCPLRVALLDTARSGATHRRVESVLYLQRQEQTREMVVLASTARVEVGGETLVLLCLEDVSVQKEAEARIRQQAALLDQTQDAVLVAGLDQRLRYCNHTAEEFFGVPAGQLMNQSVATLMFSGAPEHCAEACQATLAKGSWSGETRAAASAGHRTLSSRWTLIRDAANRPASFLIVNTDVTEQKRLEEQSLRSQRMESIGTLASGIAHDLNNILTPILIATEVLQPMAKGTDEEEVIDLLRKGAQRGADIIRQLLMFGRGVEGQRVDLQPRTLLKEMLKVIQETFPKALSVEHNLPENLWIIHADPTQVHQVLLNLCVNARDAMPHGGKLSLSAENLVLDEHYAAVNLEAKPGSYVVLEVGDTGTGISPEILHKIFDPFFTTKDPGKGTGLGLSTVLGIVKSHGGFTQVNSRLGEGTSFKVYFPALQTQKDLLPAKPAQRPPRGHGELILVVDDEESIRAVTQRVLVKFGYRVLTATDGAHGLVTFSRHKREVGAAVVDMVMPVMDGAALIRSLRHLSPELRIIAMSGLAAQQEEAEKAGVSAGAFLIKPFEPDALLILLHKVLGGRKAG